MITAILWIKFQNLFPAQRKKTLKILRKKISADFFGGNKDGIDLFQHFPCNNYFLNFAGAFADCA